MKKGFILAVLLLMGVVGSAEAQTFAPAAQKTAPKTQNQPTASAPAAQKMIMPLDKAPRVAKVPTTAGKQPATVPATSGRQPEKVQPTEAPEEGMENERKVIKNLGNENGQDNDKYDNTYRKVFHFKIVDGKLEIDDDDNRSILVFYDNYQIQKGLDNLVRCTIRLYVLNDLKTRISSLGFRLIWPDISTTVQMNQVNPGVKTYKDLMLLGEGCYSMDKAPTIEVNRCRAKGLSAESCADAIRWYQETK